jgi:hypothetical protein
MSLWIYFNSSVFAHFLPAIKYSFIEKANFCLLPESFPGHFIKDSTFRVIMQHRALANEVACNIRAKPCFSLPQKIKSKTKSMSTGAIFILPIQIFSTVIGGVINL